MKRHERESTRKLKSLEKEDESSRFLHRSGMMNAIEGGNGRRMGGLYFTANEAKDNKRVSNGDVKIPKMAQTQNEKSRKRGVDAMGDRIRSSWRAVLMEVLRPLKRLLWLARSQVGLTQKWTISLSFPCKVSKWHGSMVILCFGSNEGMNEAWKRKEDTLDLRFEFIEPMLCQNHIE
ncbi:hypothetical protein V6N11_021926 [Hibiscus sabdariffa]|uniref:Uncharacterized protein n=1 Tax=Hibiscus sabdariffa TaxID=183260 RepID=A0ABR2THN7_9ROSI